MEWIYLAGSVASVISIFVVVLGLAKRRKAITERGFKMLFTLVLTIGLVGIGVVTMALSQEPVMRNVGGAIAIGGTLLLFIIAIMVIGYSGDEE